MWFVTSSKSQSQTLQKLSDKRSNIIYTLSPKVAEKISYYSNHRGVELREFTSEMTFNLGNVVKYCWRAGKKSSNTIEDLCKARDYLNWEIERELEIKKALPN